ncbi:MAG: type II toxin-antitoxin system VapC family toxin [Thermoanaerobaculia bacterium]
MIFVDTGAFLARYVERDQYHTRARNGWRQIEKRGLPCLTTNFVLDETLTLLGRRASYEFAAERGRHLYGSRILTILRPEAAEESAAIELLEKFSDERVSFTDCVSFVLMRRQRLTRAFTFDRHFADAGFEVWP